MLIARTESGKNVGTIELKDGKLVSDNPGIESMIDSAMRKANGDAKQAYSALGKFSNGYLTIREGVKTVSDQLKGAGSDDKATTGSTPRQGRKAGRGT